MKKIRHHFLAVIMILFYNQSHVFGSELGIYQNQGFILTSILEVPPEKFRDKSIIEILNPTIISVNVGQIENAVLMEILKESKITLVDRANKEQIASLMPIINQAVQINIGNPGLIAANAVIFERNKIGILVIPNEKLALNSFLFTWQ